MTTFDEEQSLEIAKYIDQQNNERKRHCNDDCQKKLWI